MLLAPNTNVICYLPQTIGGNTNWKFCIPADRVDQTIKWYHVALEHPGMQRFHDTIALHFYSPNLHRRCVAKI
jgi:hypothetical protein